MGVPSRSTEQNYSTVRHRHPAPARGGTLAVVTEPLSPTNAPPLLTDDDVAHRVASLVGTAARDRTLWLLFVDGDGRQSPVLMPLEDLPGMPDEVVTALGRVLVGFLPELATAAGPGSVVFVRERLGPDGVLPPDRAWADALTTMCRRFAVLVRGIHLSTPNRVQRMA